MQVDSVPPCERLVPVAVPDPMPAEATASAAQHVSSTASDDRKLQDLPPGYVAQEIELGRDPATRMPVMQWIVRCRRELPEPVARKGRAQNIQIRATQERRPLLDDYAMRFGYYGAHIGAAYRHMPSALTRAPHETVSHLLTRNTDRRY